MTRYAAGRGTGYTLAGATRHIQRMWILLWLENERRPRHPIVRGRRPW
jgi:hypothetical protein